MQCHSSPCFCWNRHHLGTALLVLPCSYEAPNDPDFRPSRLSLIDRGFTFAIAHVRGGGGWAVAGLLPAVLLPGVVGCFTLCAHSTHCMQTPCINIETNAVRAGEMGRTWYEDGKYLKVGAPVQQQGGRGRRGGRLLSRHSGSSASAASDQSLSSTQPPNTPVCASLSPCCRRRTLSPILLPARSTWWPTSTPHPSACASRGGQVRRGAGCWLQLGGQTGLLGCLSTTLANLLTLLPPCTAPRALPTWPLPNCSGGADHGCGHQHAPRSVQFRHPGSSFCGLPDDNAG